MKSIRHYTVNTGDMSFIERGDVQPHVEPVLTDWLNMALKSCGEKVAIPGPDYDDFNARVFKIKNGIGITINHDDTAIVSFGIAKNTIAADKIIEQLKKISQELKVDWPDEILITSPCCIALVLPSLVLHFSAGAWIGDFEKCLAWAFCNNF